MGVELRDNETGEVRSAVVALPDGLPRRVPVPSAEAERYVMLEDLVRECIGTVFPGETVLSAAVVPRHAQWGHCRAGGRRPGPGG